MASRWHTRVLIRGAALGAVAPAELVLAPARSDAARRRRVVVTAAAAGRRHLALALDNGELFVLDARRAGGEAAAPDAPDEEAGERLTEALVVDDGGNVCARLAARCVGVRGVLGGDGATASPPLRVTCGGRHTVAYHHLTRRAAAFGSNDEGQLGVGDRRAAVSHPRGGVWDARARWWASSPGVDHVACGGAHTIVRLACGALFACGSNAHGELGVDSVDGATSPTAVAWSDGGGGGGAAAGDDECSKVAAGDGYTLFLTRGGRVRGCGDDARGQLPFRAPRPTPLPLLRDFVAPPRRSGRAIRVKNVACMAAMAVYISARDEVLVQGSLPDYGVCVPAPRLAVVRQDRAIDELCRRLRRDARRERDRGGFVIDDVVCGASTALLHYRNGCVAGFGANADGQLHGTLPRRGVAVAVDEALPVFAPRGAAAHDARACLAVGDGFCVITDPAAAASSELW